MTIQDLVGTCEQLQLARKRITDLQDDIVLQSNEIANLQADLADAKHDRNVATRELQRLRKAQAK